MHLKVIDQHRSFLVLLVNELLESQVVLLLGIFESLVPLLVELVTNFGEGGLELFELVCLSDLKTVLGLAELAVLQVFQELFVLSGVIESASELMIKATLLHVFATKIKG